MTEVPPPAPPADACAPAVSTPGASAPSGTGFRAALADVVTRAAPDSASTKAPTLPPVASAGAPASVPPAPGTGGAAPASPDGTPLLALSAIPPDVAAPEMMGGKATATPVGEHAGAAATKKAGRRGDKDDPAGGGLRAAGQPQPASALASGAVVPPIPAMPILALPASGARSGSAGDDDAAAKGRPSIGGVNGEARKPPIAPPDAPLPSAIGPVQAAKIPLAPPASDEPALKGPAAASTVMGATAQNIPMTPPAHLAAPSGAPPAPPSSSPALAQPSNSSPAAQIEPAMVSLASGAAGTHHLVVRLDPPDLGRVEVRMVRGPDAGAHVEVVAERPATLVLLRQDAPALHQALSDAGVPVQGRSLTMQLGQPGGQQLSSQAGGGHGGWSPRRFSAAGHSPRSASARIARMQFPTAMRALRSALDITA